MKNNIGKKIRKVRELKDFTQDYMGDKLSKNYEERIEHLEKEIEFLRTLVKK